MDTWTMDMDTWTVEYEPMDVLNYGFGPGRCRGTRDKGQGIRDKGQVPMGKGQEARSKEQGAGCKGLLPVCWEDCLMAMAAPVVVQGKPDV